MDGGGNIRQASFKGLREDKPAGDVEVERPAPAEKTDISEPAPPDRTSTPSSPARKPVVMGVVISKPEKALWPDAGDGQPVTKLDLAEYFAAVGAWMIGHLKGRPCSSVRAPKGLAASISSAPCHAGTSTSSNW